MTKANAPTGLDWAAQHPGVPVRGSMVAVHIPVDVSDRRKLENAIRSAGVPSNAYSVSEPKDGALCLEQSNQAYEVYLYQHGKKIVPRQFASEAEACRHMYEQLIEIHRSGIAADHSG